MIRNLRDDLVRTYQGYSQSEPEHDAPLVPETIPTPDPVRRRVRQSEHGFLGRRRTYPPRGIQRT